jgi:hypothetical protein
VRIITAVGIECLSGAEAEAGSCQVGLALRKSISDRPISVLARSPALLILMRTTRRGALVAHLDPARTSSQADVPA